jgi:hypothetical protein
MEKPSFYQINYSKEKVLENQMNSFVYSYDEMRTNIIKLFNSNSKHTHNQEGGCVLETCAIYSNETEECLKHVEKRCFPTADGCRFGNGYLRL